LKNMVFISLKNYDSGYIYSPVLHIIIDDNIFRVDLVCDYSRKKILELIKDYSNDQFIISGSKDCIEKCEYKNRITSSFDLMSTIELLKHKEIVIHLWLIYRF